MADIDDLLKEYDTKPTATGDASDIDHLLKMYPDTAPKVEPTRSRFAVDMAAPVGGEFGDLAAQPWAQGAPADQSAYTPVGKIANAAFQGFTEAPRALTPYAQDVVNRLGPVGSQIINPLIQLPFSAGNALMQGVAETANQVTGDPRAGRDVTMLGQILPMTHIGTGVPPVATAIPNPLTSRPQFVSERFAPSIAGLDTRNSISALLQHDIAENPPRALGAGNPLETMPDAATINSLAAARSGSPVLGGSVGAAASREGTPSGQIDMTRREMLVNRAQAETEKLNELQPAGKDLNRYVEGVNPTMAEMEQSVKTAREQKALATISPEIADQARALDVAHTEARQQHFKDIVGSKTDLDRLEMARSDQASKDAAAAFKPGQTTDASPVAETISSVLNQPRAMENTQLQKYVRPLLGRLYEDDGVTLKSDPEQLYGLREDINRMRSRASQAQDKNLTHVSGELGAISNVLDSAISAGASEYRTYMKNYADASRGIDELSVLQDHENGLNGLKTFTPIQRMMRKIVEARQAPGNNPYKSISDDTMARLWALRDDLRRSASAQDLARAKGSDTAQNAIDIAKNVLKAGARGAAHYGLYHATGDLGANALLGMGDMAAMRLLQQRNVKRAHEMLNPNPLQYPPPEP